MMVAGREKIHASFVRVAALEHDPEYLASEAVDYRKTNVSIDHHRN